MYEEIEYEISAPAAIVRLNRPEKLNAFTYPMMEEFRHALARAEADESVTGIILTGAGRGFCAGMDMNALDQQADAGGVAQVGAPRSTLRASPGDREMGPNFRSGFTYLMTIRKPIVAAINGPCAGLGMSIALLCDLRFASGEARFITSFSQRGLVAEHGQSWILPRIVGPSRALDLLWSSRRVGAEEALEIGLVDRLFPGAGLLDGANGYIEELARGTAPNSLKTIKQQIYRHLNMSLEEAMNETDRLMNESLTARDFKEGISSFLERRPPRFSPVRF